MWKKIIECEFWGPILHKARNIELARMSYHEWLEFIVEQLLPEKKDIVVLDSSCNLDGLQRIMRAKYFGYNTLKVIYLTRDSRGVVYSASKKGYGRGLKDGYSRHSVLRNAISWTLRNKKIIRYIESIKKNIQVAHVHYEDLSEKPDIVLRRLQHFLGVKVIGLDPNWRTAKHHTYAGNARLRSQDSSVIRERLEWRTKLTPLEMMTIEAITGGLNRTLMKKFSEKFH